MKKSLYPILPQSGHGTVSDAYHEGCRILFFDLHIVTSGFLLRRTQSYYIFIKRPDRNPLRSKAHEHGIVWLDDSAAGENLRAVQRR